MVSGYEKLGLSTTDVVVVKHGDNYVTTTVGKCIFNNALPDVMQFTEIGKISTNKQFTKNEIKVAMDMVYDIG